MTVPTTRVLRFQRDAVEVKAKLPSDAMRPVFDRIASAFEILVSRRFGISLEDLAYELKEETGTDCCLRTARRIVYLFWRMGLAEKQISSQENGYFRTTWVFKSPLIPTPPASELIGRAEQ